MAAAGRERAAHQRPEVRLAGVQQPPALVRLQVAHARGVGAALGLDLSRRKRGFDSRWGRQGFNGFPPPNSGNFSGPSPAFRRSNARAHRPASIAWPRAYTARRGVESAAGSRARAQRSRSGSRPVGRRRSGRAGAGPGVDGGAHDGPKAAPISALAVRKGLRS
jgi:hypothetical protein